MDSSKSSYVSGSVDRRELKLTAADKLEIEIQKLRDGLIYHENRVAKIVADKDKILMLLPQADYLKFKGVSEKKQEEMLQKLRAVDYKTFKRLEADQTEEEDAIVEVKAQLKTLEKPNGKKKGG